MSDLSERIDRAAKEAGISKRQLSQRLGIGASTMSRWTRGTNKGTPPIQEMARVAAITGKPLAYFLPEIDGQESQSGLERAILDMAYLVGLPEAAKLLAAAFVNRLDTPDPQARAR